MKSKLSIVDYVNRNSFLILHDVNGKVKKVRHVDNVRPSFLIEDGTKKPAFIVSINGFPSGYGIVVPKELVLVRRIK